MNAARKPARRDWRKLARAVAGRLPLNALHPRAVAAIRAQPPRAPIAIACSGGADSVALTLVLWAHFPERRGRWLIAHFNHRLRGRAADGDAQFVRQLARALGERCVIGVWRRKKTKRAAISEADARMARNEFFARVMKRAGAQLLATGHQRDDVAETMLMRFTRGSGADGLAAPRPVQRAKSGALMRVRPLLEVPAASLRETLRAAGVPWREDATNAGAQFFRNRIRAQVLPALRAASPQDALAGFAASRAQLEDDEEALQTWLAELVPPPGRGKSYDLSALRKRPRALLRRAVRAWLASADLADALSRVAVEAVIDAVQAARAAQFSAGVAGLIVVAAGRIRLARATPSATRVGWSRVSLRPGAKLRGPNGDRLEARWRRCDARLWQQLRRGAFSAARFAFLDPGSGWAGAFTVRSRQPGDRYRPLGAPGRAKLQDLLINRKVPREQRAGLPVVCDASDAVVWAPGLAPAAELAVQPTSKLVVQLTYTPAPDIVTRSISTS